MKFREATIPGDNEKNSYKAAYRTACTLRQHPTLERSDLFTDDEWNTLYTEAEKRIKTRHDLVDDSIRQQLILQTLRSHDYDQGEREFTSMPLAAEKLAKKTYTEWSGPATVLGDITSTADRPGNPLFSLKSQFRCTKLITSHVPGPDYGVIVGALCKDLMTDESFLVKAKKYVVCAGAVPTPGILFNSGFGQTSGELPALVSQPVVSLGPIDGRLIPRLDIILNGADTLLGQIHDRATHDLLPDHSLP